MIDFLIQHGLFILFFLVLYSIYTILKPITAMIIIKLKYGHLIELSFSPLTGFDGIYKDKNGNPRKKIQDIVAKNP